MLLRPRRGASPSERVKSLLQSSLFHLVRDNSALVSKVKAVAGDCQMPGLGISPVDRATLQKSVNVIIHCAADIRLEPSIQETLQVCVSVCGAVVWLGLGSASALLRAPC